MGKQSRLPLSQSRRWWGSRVRLLLYAVVVMLSLSWYAQAERQGHVAPELLRLQKLREAVQNEKNPAVKQTLLDELIDGSRHNEKFAYKELWAWAKHVKADRMDDPEGRNVLLEEIIDANLANGEFGLRQSIMAAVRKRAGYDVGRDGWERSDEEFLEKYRDQTARDFRQAMTVVWQRKINCEAKGPGREELLTEYRGWLEARRFSGNEYQQAWVIGEQARNTDDISAKAALFEEIGDLFGMSKNDNVLGYVVWSLRQRAELLPDAVARLASYKDIDARYKHYRFLSVQKQVAYALSLQASLLEGVERERVYDEIMSRYGKIDERWFLAFVKRIRTQRDALKRGSE